MAKHCENCGCAIRSGYCTNCQEEAYIAFVQAPEMEFSEEFMQAAFRQDSQRSTPEAMTVTHNGRQYTTTKLNDNEWKLTSVANQRENIVMSRQQLHIAGLLEKVEGKP